MCGNGCNMGNNSCLWIILILILIFCCGNNGCDNDTRSLNDCCCN